MDYEQLAASIDEVREMLRAMVAGFMTDGYTEEQARSLVVCMFVLFTKSDTEEEE